MTRKEARPNFARSNKRRAFPVHFRLIHPRFRGGQTLHAICPPDKVLVTQNVHADDSGLNSGKWNCSVCCSGDVFLISLRHLQNSIQNTHKVPFQEFNPESSPGTGWLPDYAGFDPHCVQQEFVVPQIPLPQWPSFWSFNASFIDRAASDLVSHSHTFVGIQHLL